MNEYDKHCLKAMSKVVSVTNKVTTPRSTTTKASAPGRKK